MKIALVKLNDVGKNILIDINNKDVKKRNLVIVEMDKKIYFGRVEKVLLLEKFENKYISGKIIRVATSADLQKIKDNINDSEKALKKCIELVKKYNLNMKIIDSNYTFSREQLSFKFLSDDRVDFRQLAKDLGAIFKTRIELHQVGIRDKAREIGGIGPCGLTLCCHNFLKSIDSVSINMAKNQNLSLNPSKINGVCGRLLCCLKYENDNYIEYKKGLPEVNSKIKTEDGFGKVVSVDVFNKTYKVLLDTSSVIEISEKDDCKE